MSSDISHRIPLTVRWQPLRRIMSPMLQFFPHIWENRWQKSTGSPTFDISRLVGMIYGHKTTGPYHKVANTTTMMWWLPSMPGIWYDTWIGLDLKSLLDLKFAYSLYNFYGAAMMFKGRLLSEPPMLTFFLGESF